MKSSPVTAADEAPRRRRRRLRFADLFAGLGGFHVGLSRLGYHCVFASEYDDELRDLYCKNFSVWPSGDIRRVSKELIPDHDILCAGFPCQPFSKAGSQGGTSCPKFGDLFDEVVTVLRAKSPTYFILENVPNLVRHDHGRTWRSMAAQLGHLGYSTETAIVSPHHYGIPQIRERLFVVGSLNGLGHLRWPEKTETPLSIEAVLDQSPVDARPLSAHQSASLGLWQEFLDRIPAEEDLPWFPVWSMEFGATYPFEGITPWSLGTRSLAEYRGSHGVDLRALSPSRRVRALPSYAQSSEPRFPSWKEKFIRQNREYYWRHRRRLEGWIDKVRELPPSLQKFEWHCRGEQRTLRDHLIQFRASGVRVKRSNWAPALVAMNTTQVPVIPRQSRYMTTRECSRLQGLDGLVHLPSRDEAAFRALGNAVNADVVERIARALTEGAIDSAVTARSLTPVNCDVAREASNVPNRISIRPGVSVLSVLKHLNYHPWYALAEFVDNAAQSFLANRRLIEKADGKKAKLRVRIDIDPDTATISVRDNAAGIAQQDYQRAFRTAAIPEDRSGLSEFGMGMKSAACWFAPRWSVRTKALGEREERTVSFDISKIVKDSLEELDFKPSPAERHEHYTEITLSGVYKIPQKKTLGKIKAHLASIYRVFIRQGLLDLRINNEDPLTYDDPAILHAPSFKTPKAKAVEWKKTIDIALGGGRRAHGFAAIREVGSTSGAGFALFRRGRLIQGSADEGYRPEAIFGRSNSFAYQRLFGELTLEGFEVSHTKDGFRWDETEEDFLELLKQELDARPLPLLQQAREYRVKPNRNELKDAAEQVTQRAATVIEADGASALDRAEALGPGGAPAQKFTPADSLTRRLISLDRNGTRWNVILETTADPEVGNWVDVFDRDPEKGARSVGVRVSLSHPFTQQFAGSDREILEPLVRVAAALALAEVTARDVGVRKSGVVRLHLNELLRETFSKVAL